MRAPHATHGTYTRNVSNWVAAAAPGTPNWSAVGDAGVGLALLRHGGNSSNVGAPKPTALGSTGASVVGSSPDHFRSRFASAFDRATNSSRVRAAAAAVTWNWNGMNGLVSRSKNPPRASNSSDSPGAIRSSPFDPSLRKSSFARAGNRAYSFAFSCSQARSCSSRSPGYAVAVNENPVDPAAGRSRAYPDASNWPARLAAEAKSSRGRRRRRRRG